ncbi:MYND finger protein [Rhizoctonia solani AG-3 Rhs1AP]|uniref:MYND finger protein n=1 Tax=Rhizoctonia solani AG-3 Rhs1AP TaxID=1086054 RepID=X8IWF4_9AGAM|nr:MYND finger protein [Rhizoctonia solani AG-3 Rhs1AP]
MSHPPQWPAKYFFYPLGITAAMSLTRDLAPEQSADILILGSGDPRNLLFTIYSDLTIGNVSRAMDITFCDVEPATLARNVLLVSLLENRNENMDLIWDVFHHMKISDSVARTIQAQTQKLQEYAQDIQTWKQCPLGSFIHMVDTRTLAELCRHWKNYADFFNLPVQRKNKLFKEFLDLSKTIAVRGKTTISASRSAGMMWNDAISPVSDMFLHYWRTGTTFTEDRDIKSASNLNPTFCYSRSGETFDPHYGTFPQGFHLGAAFAPIAEDPVGPLPETGSAPINKSKQQFSAWCSAFRTARAANAITLRLYCGDALPFCHALQKFKSTRNPATGLFSSPFRATQINLDELAASSPPAPLTFDVIDTSGLVDHVGLLNMLIVTPDLLKTNPSSQSVIYTESLLQHGKDFTKSFVERLCTDVPTFAALFGIAPRPHLSGFTPESNIHELIFSNQKIHSLFGDEEGPSAQVQYHERMVWTNPYGGDPYASGKHVTVAFEPESLARVLFEIYDKMLANERVRGPDAPQREPEELRELSWAHYNRESVAYLFRGVQKRVYLPEWGWHITIRRFLEMGEADKLRPADAANYRDTILQLHCAGVMTFDELMPNWAEDPRFRPSARSPVLDGWKSLPPIVCIVLTVPRRRLTKAFGAPLEQVGTPTLMCCIRYRRVAHNLGTIHAVWGRCIKSRDSDRFVIEEDPNGKQGHSDLIVSFWAPTRIVEELDTCVNLQLKPTISSVFLFHDKLPEMLEVFSAKMTDKHHVTVLPYRPTLASEPRISPPEFIRPPPPVEYSAHVCHATVAENDGQFVTSLFVRFNVISWEERACLLRGAAISAEQISPCTMELRIGSFTHQLVYSYPIQGKDPRIRVARKSGYVEVIVPVSTPSNHSGYSLNPFPVLGRGTPVAWNLHNINLDRLPRLNTRNTAKLYWIDHLCKHQLSDPEKMIRNGDELQRQGAEHTPLNFKSTIHSIAAHRLDKKTNQNRTIALYDKDEGKLYATLFIGGIRLDLASMTIAFDTAVVPMTGDEKTLNPLLGLLLDSLASIVPIVTNRYETIAWKQALPAFVERCRTWSHRPSCEYQSRGQIPLSVDFNKNPICTCGQGIGMTSPQWEAPGWEKFIPLATRAAICPIFALSYLETVIGDIDEYVYGRLGSTIGNCCACGDHGKPNLEMCSRCKKARYCSKICQRMAWKTHKKDCKAPSSE